MGDNSEPQSSESHKTDKYGTKLVDKTGALQQKFHKLTGHHDNNDATHGPAGGYDDTALPSAPAGHTIRITFHRAENLPFSDFPSFSTDAYIHATFKTALPSRHKQDPDLFLRTPTIHRNTSPRWETQWVIAHVPASGFFLKCRLYDEDPADHDDRLGNVHVNVNSIHDDWQGIHEQPYDLKKRMGSKRAYTFRGVAALFNKSIKMSGRLFVSVENLGRSPGESGGRCFTVAPLPWARHNSPLIGRIVGTKDREESKNGKKSVEKYNFQAVQMQLKGPVPAPLYHRYVEFKPFVAGMFTDATLRGRILNRALHHQHARVYNYDTSTIYGVFENPCIEMTRQFLEFVHYDQGGRIYTYVLSLDGQWRFTETGKEFGIDMLSKHTMHSDVSIYIAFSGEFFIRRIKRQGHDRTVSASTNGEKSSSHGGSMDASSGELLDDLAPPRDDDENDTKGTGEHSHDDISKNPSDYELIIDNDSGTYRPKAELLPLLRDYFAACLPGLRVATLDCQEDEKIMTKLKSEQRDRKQKSGKQITYMQNSSDSSLSSSDEEKLDAVAEGRGTESGYKRKLAKLQARRKDKAAADEHIDNNTSHVAPTPAPHGHARELSNDSRDYSSSVSTTPESRRDRQRLDVSHDAVGGEHQDGGYENHELPLLLKRDANKNAASSPAYSQHEEKKSDELDHYVEPETGDNKPAGGIVYGQVISTAGVEKN